MADTAGLMSPHTDLFISCLTLRQLVLGRTEACNRVKNWRTLVGVKKGFGSCCINVIFDIIGKTQTIFGHVALFLLGTN